MKSILTALVVLNSTMAMATPAKKLQAPCENYAKYFAIRDYKSSMGTVQGSDGIEVSSELKYSQGRNYGFEVAISDNNEDGEMWTVLYQIVVKPSSQRAACDLVSLKFIEAD